MVDPLTHLPTVSGTVSGCASQGRGECEIESNIVLGISRYQERPVPQLLHQDCDQNTHVHHGHLGDRVVSSTTSAAGQLVELLQNVSIIIGPRCNWGPIYGS